MAHDHEATARGDGRGGLWVDGCALLGRDVKVDDDDEIKRPSRRSPGEQVALQPIYFDTGCLGLRPSVGQPDGRPVDSRRAPALGGQPHRVRAAAGRKLERGAGSQIGDANDQCRIRPLALEVAVAVTLVPSHSARICTHG